MLLKQKTFIVQLCLARSVKSLTALSFAIVLCNYANAQSVDSHTSALVKDKLSGFFTPKSNPNFNQANFSELSDFNVYRSKSEALPVIGQEFSGSNRTPRVIVSQTQKPESFNQTILMALQRSPLVTQSIANVASQNSTIDVARAAYYPQLSGGFSSADLSDQKGYGQVLSLNATQMIYDFGKVKSSVGIEQKKLAAAQANVLVDIDKIAYDTAIAIINIKRYQRLTEIAKEQIEGISHIAEITDLRAKAGISTQADPVQAKSNLESAQSTLIVQQTQLSQYEQKLRTLLGVNVESINFSIPESIVADSNLYEEPKFNMAPKMIVAQTEVAIAKQQKEQTRLSNYPTVNVKGSLSQAVNGKHPSNNEDDGTDSSIMLEATSTFYQGGAISSRNKAASFAEEAAKAKVSSVYLDVLDELRIIRAEIDHKQSLLGVLSTRKATTIRLRELYQEQYKLGTRSAVDLLNAEQSIHSAAQEIENSRYDIYAALAKYLSITGQSFDAYQLKNTSIQGFMVQP